jgi:hypothetical protein
MATSGTTTFDLTRDSIINAALRKLSVIAKGQTAETLDVTNASEALNVMLKTFETKGMPLWAINEYTFPMTATRTYNIGVGKTLNTPAPLKITQAYIKDTITNYSTPINIQTHYDYNLSNPKSNDTGTPVNLEYEPLNQQGNIRLWPTPDTYSISSRSITITYQRPFEDMTASTDAVDFPQYWLEAVIYGLASRLAPEYGLPLPDRADLRQEAAYFLNEAMSFGSEEGSLFFQPNWQGMR